MEDALDFTSLEKSQASSSPCNARNKNNVAPQNKDQVPQVLHQWFHQVQNPFPCRVGKELLICH